MAALEQLFRDEINIAIRIDKLLKTMSLEELAKLSLPAPESRRFDPHNQRLLEVLLYKHLCKKMNDINQVQVLDYHYSEYEGLLSESNHAEIIGVTIKVNNVMLQLRHHYSNLKGGNCEDIGERVVVHVDDKKYNVKQNDVENLKLDPSAPNRESVVNLLNAIVAILANEVWAEFEDYDFV